MWYNPVVEAGGYQAAYKLPSFRWRGAGEFLFRLKLIADTALLQNSICGMPGFDFCINSHVPVGNRAVPNIMVAFPTP